MLRPDRLIVDTERHLDEPEQLATPVWLTRLFIFCVALLGLAWYGVDQGWWG